MSTINCANCDKIVEKTEQSCPDCESTYCAACQPQQCACGYTFPITCPHCDESLPAATAVCPHCGHKLSAGNVTIIPPQWHSVPDIEGVASSRPMASAYTVVAGKEGADEDGESDAYTGVCPECETEIYIEDGFCSSCGQMVCYYCGGATEEEDESCPKCSRQLFWDCPSCEFELTAGTDLCPNCQTLFPNYCAHCHEQIIPGDQECSYCKTAVVWEKRFTVRVVHSLVTSERLVQIVACPDCGTHFDPLVSNCPECHFLICSGCQLNLQPEEARCLRCGTAVADSFPCPKCTHLLAPECDHCDKCGLNLCPECHAEVNEMDTACTQCGAEFELVCPSCAKPVDANKASCPHCQTTF